MTWDFRALSILISIILLLLERGSFTYSDQSDVDCLRSIVDSFEDPFNNLKSWNFNNNTEGFICKFKGVECWKLDENRVLNIQMSNMGLKGKFPLGVAGCLSLTGLDLSNNMIYGNIPNNISRLLRYVTALDLSSNQLSGEIPMDFADCTYLNVLELDNNQLTGQIPAQIGMLFRLRSFTVTKNRLSGPVPQFNSSAIPAESYANNAGLCGNPLPLCRENTHIAVIVGAAVGGVTVAALAICIGFMFFLRKPFISHKVLRNKKEEDPLCNKWAKSIKDAKGIKARNIYILLEFLLLKIGIGATKGLAWLYHSCNPHIIHRNISSSCILLNLHYEPKISDSGLTSLMNPIGAHLGTFVNGKFGDVGYVPPEPILY
ncbi:putative inactive leucine-rich repeat receptor-like protein kinase [Forsythia ovata]|uniref:Inactive leucine-rich repeat receptor-like protein kinase n=1 Tax=Forsythia ovata TaxID=205694 RepID=A0ABD1T6A0_9LAMI